MSIIRFSCIRNTLFAPAANGAHIADVDGARGFLGTFTPARFTEFPRLAGWLDEELTRAAPALGPDSPICILVHGFQFDPRDDVDRPRHKSINPHRRIYHFDAPSPGEAREDERRFHTTGWPARLGFADDAGETGLAIAYGWYSNPALWESISLWHMNHHRKAYEYGVECAWPLAHIIRQLTLDPRTAGRPIHLFCHSLGTRLVTQTIHQLILHSAEIDPAGDVFRRLGRVILVGGSTRVKDVEVMLNDLNKHRDNLTVSGPEFFNFALKNDLVLDHLAEKSFGHGLIEDLQVIGHNGFDRADPDSPPDNWIDFQIDGDNIGGWLAGLDPARTVAFEKDRFGQTHWSYYTALANTQLYTAILRDAPKWVLNDMLKGAGHGVAPDSVTNPVFEPDFPEDWAMGP